MKKLILIPFIVLCIQSISAQTPGFRYGGHFGLGESGFNSLGAGISQQGKLNLYAGIAASEQFTNHFGLDADALFVSKGERLSGETTDTDVLGNTKTYTYNDNYHLFYAELPLLLKLSIGWNNFFLKGFAGPSINFNLMALQSRTYQDANYDANHGYLDARMNNINVMELAGVFGAGIDVQSGENIFSLDFRISHAYDSFGKINNYNAYNNYFAVGFGYVY